MRLLLIFSSFDNWFAVVNTVCLLSLFYASRALVTPWRCVLAWRCVRDIIVEKCEVRFVDKNTENLLKVLGSDPDKYWSSDELQTAFQDHSLEQITECAERLHYKKLAELQRYLGGKYCIRNTLAGKFYFEGKAELAEAKQEAAAEKKAEKWSDRRWSMAQAAVGSLITWTIGFGMGYLTHLFSH